LPPLLQSPVIPVNGEKNTAKGKTKRQKCVPVNLTKKKKGIISKRESVRTKITKKKKKSKKSCL